MRQPANMTASSRPVRRVETADMSCHACVSWESMSGQVGVLGGGGELHKRDEQDRIDEFSNLLVSDFLQGQ